MSLRELQEQALRDLKGRVPKGFYDEFAYCCVAYNRGKITKEAFIAVSQDILGELRSQKAIAPVVPRRVGKNIAYYINTDEIQFNLQSEPTEEGFYNSYYDIPDKEVEIYRADTPLEQKGRLVAPLFLDGYLSFLMGDKSKGLGIDVARYGDDKTVFCLLWGGHCVDIQSYYKQDVAETTGRAIEAINEWHPDSVMIDITGGLGAGVHDNLQSLGMEEFCDLYPIEFHSKPRDPEKYNAADARTEMFLILQHRCRLGEITLPFHKPLIEELSWIRFKIRLDGRAVLESKDICKKRNKRSPDHADALALANYGTVSAQVF